MEITINTENISGELYPLCHPSSSQTACAYVELDTASGELSADWESDQNACPMRVYEGRCRRYEIYDPDRLIDAEAIAALLGEIAPVAARICDAYNDIEATPSDVYDLELEMEAAIDAALPDLMEPAGVWDAADWLLDSDVVTEYGITGNTTDDQLWEIASKIEADAASVVGIRVDGVLRYLKRERDTLPLD